MWCQGLSTPTHMDNIKRWGQRRGGSAISELFLTSNRKEEASLLQALRFTASSSFFIRKKKFPLFGLGIFQLFCFFLFNVDILCIYIKTKLALFSRNWCCVFPICSIQCSLPNCRPVSVPRGRGGGEHHKILYFITHELQTVRLRQ
jgi:hypothetical protein